jgi:pimeloyl-ACP methyl ester carboxylesterase
MTRSSLCRLSRRHILEALMAFSLPGVCCIPTRGHAQTIAPNRDAHKPSTKTPDVPAWLKLPPTPTLPHEKRKSGLAKANGASLYFAQFGEGPPVLLLHGGLGNSNYWGHQVEVLQKQFSVTVIDTRGHGRSPVLSHSFSYGTFAEDVVAVMDLLEISAAAIIGWSDGAITGLQLAVDRPDRVSRLFAFGANSSPDGLKANGPRTAVFQSFSQRCKAEYAQLSPHPERWAQLVAGLRVMWRSEPKFTRQMLAGIKRPVTISQGEYDEIIKRDHTEQMARAIPDARLVIQPRVSHFAMLQDPVQFNRVLSEFLKT